MPPGVELAPHHRPQLPLGLAFEPHGQRLGTPLQTLDLDRLSLTGTLPTSWGALTALTLVGLG